MSDECIEYLSPTNQVAVSRSGREWQSPPAMISDYMWKAIRPLHTTRIARLNVLEGYQWLHDSDH